MYSNSLTSSPTSKLAYFDHYSRNKEEVEKNQKFDVSPQYDISAIDISKVYLTISHRNLDNIFEETVLIYIIANLTLFTIIYF